MSPRIKSKRVLSADQASSKKKVYNNLEIADLIFGEAYSAFFEYFDNSLGGFYEVKSSLSSIAAPNKNQNYPNCMYHIIWNSVAGTH